ncbi:MAG: LysR family transcriptional regulator [Betaproteobacteria bacterium]
MLTHRHVEVFRAVMTAGSVTGAAESLFTSQPTISRDLARMEMLLRLVLFDRVRGRLQPTAQAWALFDEVQRSYAGLERVADTALRLRQFTEGQLSLACLPAFSHALLPGACARFQKAHPGVSVSVNPYESPLLEERLAAQAHDLGLTEHDSAPAGAPARLLLELDEVAVLPAGHPLLARKRLGAADFAGQPFVSFHPRDRYRQGVDKVFADAGVDRQLAVETDSAVAVCAMVQHGLGLAIVNPLTALAIVGKDVGKDGGRGAGIAIRPLAFAIPFRVYAVRPAHRPRNPLVARFEAALEAECEALGRQVARAWKR